MLRYNIIFEYCWRYHFANPNLADRDCYLINRQSPNAGLECLVNDFYSNKARRWSKRGWLSKKFDDCPRIIRLLPWWWWQCDCAWKYWILCHRIVFPPLGIWAQITPGHFHGQGRFIYRLLVSGNGERDRIRTCDPVIKSHLLYQLSYAPEL